MSNCHPWILVSAYNTSSHSQIDCHSKPVVLSDDEAGLNLMDPEASGWALQLEPAEGNRIAATNVGDRPIRDQPTGAELPSGERVELDSGSILQIGQSNLVLTVVDDEPLDDARLRLLENNLVSPLDNGHQETVIMDGSSPSPQTLTKWFDALGVIQRQATCSPEFYQAAVNAIVDPGGLDAGLMLDRIGDGWRVRCSRVANAPIGIAFDPQLAETAYRVRCTVYHASPVRDGVDDAEVSVFATPVFDDLEQVVGVLYGHRRFGDANRRRGIRQLEAHWIQLVAEAVSAGVIRRAHEANAARQHVLLEQVFPPAVVRRISNNVDTVLASEERDVTVMFADLIGSSGISERLSAAETHQMLADVLDAMTMGVQSQGGTIVDYYGDGLIAMWNAPLDQPDHATRACSAAMELIAHQQSLDSTWAPFIGRPIEIGIGIHSGRAIVGNSGSTLRLKYGPRGLVVNLASRVERATRYLDVPVLISEATRRLLETTSQTCRLGRFRLWGIDDPIDLFALYGMDPDGAGSRVNTQLTSYERALRLFEAGDLTAALDELDHIANAVTDEYCLKFLRKQLEDSLTETRIDQANGIRSRNLVFDLTAASL